jgi:hypothetical protein
VPAAAAGPVQKGRVPEYKGGTTLEIIKDRKVLARNGVRVTKGDLKDFRKGDKIFVIIINEPIVYGIPGAGSCKCGCQNEIPLQEVPMFFDEVRTETAYREIPCPPNRPDLKYEKYFLQGYYFIDGATYFPSYNFDEIIRVEKID